MKVLLTGASGFLGRHLLSFLINQHDVLASVRTVSCHSNRDFIAMGDISGNVDWSQALKGRQVVIHTAARVHVLNDVSADPLAEFRHVNVDGTLNLARQAVAAGVRRFVFVSSIGVNGNCSLQPFTERDRPAPHDPYSISKWEAEQGLQMLAQNTGLEIVIIRPPLIYGPNAPGNFSSVLNLVNKGIPLPLGAIHNQRSFIGLDNLVALIAVCIDHPVAANQTFLISDGTDLSTAELFQRVGSAMGRSARLIPVPGGVLKFGLSLLGKKAMAQQLCNNLQVDSAKVCSLLDWRPPYTVEEGIRKAVESFKYGKF